MLAYVILAPVALVTVLGTAMAAALAYSVLFKPLIDVPNKKPRQGWHRVTGFLKDVTYILPRALRRKVNQFGLEHIGVLTRTAGSAAPPVIAAINQLEDTTRRTAGTLEDMAEQTFRALWTLNHETMPRKIAAALLPLRNQLTRHTGRLDQLEDLNRRVAVEIGDGLRELPWGVPGGYVSNFAAWWNTYTALWRHVYDNLTPRLNDLLRDTLPRIRQDISDLSRRLDVQIDARLDALGNRITDLERWAENTAKPRLQALTEAVDLLNDQVFGPVAGGLTALLERVVELERQVSEVIPERFAELERGLAELRIDLEEGIRQGLDTWRQRVTDLEREVFTVLPATLAAMQLAIDTLAQEVFDEVGVGLSALTARIVAIEAEIQDRILPGFDLILGRITALETDIRDNLLPRLRAIEDLLAPAAFAALVIAAMRTAAPNLFCRNTTRVTEEICAADPGLIDELLLLMALLLGPVSITEFARLLQSVTDEVNGGIHYFVTE